MPTLARDAVANAGLLRISIKRVDTHGCVNFKLRRSRGAEEDADLSRSWLIQSAIVPVADRGAVILRRAWLARAAWPVGVAHLAFDFCPAGGTHCDDDVDATEADRNLCRQSRGACSTGWEPGEVVSAPRARA